MLHFLVIYLLPRESGMPEMAGGSGLEEDRISKREGLYDAFGRKIPFISYPLYQSFLGYSFFTEGVYMDGYRGFDVYCTA